MSEASSQMMPVPVVPLETGDQPVPQSESAAPQQPPEFDKHAPKVPANHQSLKLLKPRMLNRARVIGTIVCAAGVGIGAVVLGFIPVAETPESLAATEPERQLPPPADNFAVPDLLRNAPDNSSPLPRPTSSDSKDRVLTASANAADPLEGIAPPGVADRSGAYPPPPSSGPPVQYAVPDPQRQARVDLLERARTGPIAFDLQIPGLDDQIAGSTRPSSPEAPGAAVPPAVPAGMGLGGLAPGQASEEPDPNRQADKVAFLQQNSKPGAAYVSDQLRYPLSPYEVKAGAIIPTTLLTGINSDLPGEVVGQVRENVYDTVTGEHLLIPQGSRLLATLDSSVAYGQERVLLCWSRLIRPDGSSLSLECAPGVDLAGQSGFADQVDNHWGKLITGVVLSSLLSATTQAAVGTSGGFQPSLPQLWASGAATEVNAVGQQFTRKNLAVQPTIKIRPGFSVNVLVNKDLILSPYPRK